MFGRNFMLLINSGLFAVFFALYQATQVPTYEYLSYGFLGVCVPFVAQSIAECIGTALEN